MAPAEGAGAVDFAVAWAVDGKANMLLLDGFEADSLGLVGVDAAANVAGADVLLESDGAVLDAVVSEGGSWKETFFCNGGVAAFFSSSSFLRSFAMASASRSCFSHFE